MSISSVSSTSNTSTSTASAAAAFRANRTFQSALTSLNEQIDTFEHQTTADLDNNTAVTLPSGVSADASNSSSGTSTPASTIAAGFAGLESTTESQLSDLTPDQQTQLTAENTKLATELNRFQNFAAHRGSVIAHQSNQYNGLTTYLGDQINAYEHQVTAEIDNGQTVTTPSSLQPKTLNASTTTDIAAAAGSEVASTTTEVAAPTTASTATTTADTIAAGFAALEADVSKRLGHLSPQYAADFQQIQSNLATEQTRFTSFAARRAAYLAANPKAAANSQTASTTNDIAA